MKKILLLSGSLVGVCTHDQQGKVGINQSTPATDALLEHNAANKALLTRRVLNGNALSSQYNNCTVPTQLAQYPEP